MRVSNSSIRRFFDEIQTHLELIVDGQATYMARFLPDDYETRAKNFLVRLPDIEASTLKLSSNARIVANLVHLLSLRKPKVVALDNKQVLKLSDHPLDIDFMLDTLSQNKVPLVLEPDCFVRRGIRTISLFEWYPNISRKYSGYLENGYNNIAALIEDAVHIMVLHTILLLDVDILSTCLPWLADYNEKKEKVKDWIHNTSVLENLRLEYWDADNIAEEFLRDWQDYLSWLEDNYEQLYN